MKLTDGEIKPCTGKEERGRCPTLSKKDILDITVLVLSALLIATKAVYENGSIIAAIEEKD